jgi:hypothetical protein
LPPPLASPLAAAEMPLMIVELRHASSFFQPLRLIFSSICDIAICRVFLFGRQVADFD